MSLVRGLSSLTVYHDQKRMDDGEDLTFNIHAPPPPGISQLDGCLNRIREGE